MAITPRQLNRATLARQSLLQRQSTTVADAVRGAVALQAQEPASPYLALWNRVAGFEPADLDKAFDEQAVVKATLMRITLHAVHADDYATFHQAMERNLRAARLGDRRFTGTGLTIADVDALLPDLLDHLAEPRAKAEIEAFLEAHVGATPEPGVWWALRTYAPLHHAPTGAPWTFGLQPSFVAAPPAARDDAEVALQGLVRRYLEGFGPATIADIGQFSLQQRGGLRAAVEALGDDLVRLDGPDGTVLYDVPDGEVPDEDTPAPPRLLGMWDSVLLAYHDRSRVLPEDYRKVVIRTNGDVLPTVLVDGHVAGVWRPVDGGANGSSGGIEVHAFHRLHDDAWTALADEAADLVELLADRDPAVYTRYRRWWTKLPDAEVRVVGT